MNGSRGLKHNMHKKIIIAFLAVIFIASGIWYYLRSGYKIIDLYENDKTHLVVEGEIVKSRYRPVIEDGNILFPLPIIKEYIDPKVHKDENRESIIFTTADKVVKMRNDEITAMINAKPVELNIPVRNINDIYYVPIELLSDIFGIDLQYLEANNIVIMDYRGSFKKEGELISDNGIVRLNPYFRSPIVSKDIKKGTKMRVFEEFPKWYKVRLKDGIVGYINKNHIEVTDITVRDTTEDISDYTPWKPEKGKINLVWEHVHKYNPNVNEIQKMDGLDIVAPTWFEIEDKQGFVSNKADMNYVKWAHNNGYKVWGVIKSFEPDITNDVLNDSDKRDEVIRQLLIYADLYDIDGINIDFENVYLNDKDMLTQFVRELAPLCREQGLVISIDVTPKSTSENWSMCYDRKALTEAVDYIALMTYDQHWATSPIAGSVAQYSWVEKSLVDVLKEVPAHKLLLGIPFYTREWKEEINNGKKKVSSRTLWMKDVKEIIENENISPVWDEESKQYYLEYIKDGDKYKIWVEDAKSIDYKSSLVHKYNLAGVASWRRGFETKDIWNVLEKNIKKTENYTTWLERNDT